MLRRLILAWHFRRAHSNNPRVRFSATQALVASGGDAGLDLLLRCLRDRDSAVRCSAATGLGNLGNPLAVGPLVAALGDEEPTVRWNAAASLAKLRDVRAVDPLVSALSHSDQSLRRAAATALGELGEPTAIGPLIQSLGSSAPSVRRAAAEALRRLGEATWTKLIHGDSHDLLHLAESGDARAVQPLIEAVRSAELVWCLAAVEALGTLGELAIDPLIQKLKESNKEVRSAVIPVLFEIRGEAPLTCIQVWPAVAQLLAELGDSQAVDLLIYALTNKNGPVRRTAAEALARLGQDQWQAWVRGDDRDLLRLGECCDRRVVDQLISVLSDKTHPQSLGAVISLGKLGDRRAVQPLVTALRSRDSGVKLAAAEALGKLGDGQAVRPLVANLANKDGTVRLAVANALSKLGEKKWSTSVIGDERDIQRLGECGDSRAVDPLITALNEQGHPLRSDAAVALGKLGDPRALKPLLAAVVGRARESARCAAAEAFGELGLEQGRRGDWRAADLLSTALRNQLNEAAYGAAAQVSAKLGVVLWKLGDPRGELLVHTALWRGAVGVRRTVAEELAKVGDERSMKSLVNRLGSGDEPDEPIRESLVRHSNACSIRLLCGALDYNKRSVRLSAAKVLISLAESRPELIGDAWERIRSRVTNRHIDKTEHRDKRNGSTDCYSYMEHTDYPDIGLSFPERPTPLRQVQSAVPVPCPGQVMTLSCPACGRPVDVPIDTAGNTFSCPVCMAPFQLPREPNAKSASARKSGSPRAPEMISAVCPNPRCRKRVKTSARNAGRAARCPNCGTVFRLQSDVGIDVNPDF